MVVDSKQKTMTALNYEKDDTIIEITNNKKIDNQLNMQKRAAKPICKL